MGAFAIGAFNRQVVGAGTFHGIVGTSTLGAFRGAKAVVGNVTKSLTLETLGDAVRATCYVGPVLTVPTVPALSKLFI